MTTDQASILLFITLGVAFLSGCSVGATWAKSRTSKPKKARHAAAR
jgi:hypothetical protein